MQTAIQFLGADARDKVPGTNPLINTGSLDSRVLSSALLNCTAPPRCMPPASQGYYVNKCPPYLTKKQFTKLEARPSPAAGKACHTSQGLKRVWLGSASDFKPGIKHHYAV